MARRRKARSKLRKLVDWSLTVVGLGVLAIAIVKLEQSSSSELIGRASIVDGDSLVINNQRIRLFGIDAPEMSQQCTHRNQDWSCGREARRHLARLIGRRDVTCVAGTVDDFDRWLAVCNIADVELNQQMVEDGWAVSYSSYPSAESRAKAAKRGIWRGSFERPRDWRDAQRGSASGLNLLD